MHRPESHPVLPLPPGIRPVDVVRALGDVDLVWSDRSAAAVDRVSFVGVASRARTWTQEAAPAAVLAALRDGAVVAPSPRLGWWGWFGYELGSSWAGVSGSEPEAPAAAFLHADVGVRFDHDADTAEVVALPGREGAATALHALLRAAPAAADGPAPDPDSWTWRHDREAYLAMLAACRAAIAAGDAYQLCLTNRATVRFRRAPDPVEVFRRLRAAAPVPGALLLRIGGWSLAAVSPETFLAVDREGRARSRPIKGTRRRDPDPGRDAALKAELLASDKERAENTMIVDLVRNDLARVARVGSVEVRGLLEVETYPAVHQLVSTVEADLAGDALDAVRALLPAGSMTGTPKRSAMTILRALEQGPRGVYAGAAGRISADGTVDLAVVIRSVVLHGTTATVGTGGGVTILSSAEEEWEETRLKARPLLGALGVDLGAPPTGRG